MIAPADPLNVDSEWSQVNKANEVNRETLRHINRHFRQVYNTPTASGQFLEEFGSLAVNTVADQVLQGTYQPSTQMDQHMCLLLAQLEQPANIRRIPKTISREEFQAVWKIAREKTTSSPHNVHFGHFKAIARDDELSTMMAMLTSIPLMTRLSLIHI